MPKVLLGTFIWYHMVLGHTGLHPLDQPKKTWLLSVWLLPSSSEVNCSLQGNNKAAAIEISVEHELGLNLKASVARHEFCGKDRSLLLCDQISLIYVRTV